jgi:hypothetical protein
MKVLAPCLDISRFAPPPPIHPAISLHEGWCAARSGEPFDMTQPMAWQEGYELWKTRELDAGIRALRQALLSGGVPAREAPRPRAFPRF